MRPSRSSHQQFMPSRPVAGRLRPKIKEEEDTDRLESGLLRELANSSGTPLVAINRPADSQSIPSVSSIRPESIDPFFSDRLSSQPQASTSRFDLISNGFNSTAEETISPQLTFNPLTSSLGRDILLSYAQRDYMTSVKPGSSRPTAVPIHRPAQRHLGKGDNVRGLLTILRTFHPTHLPTLLLLGCTYFASGDLTSSLEINQEILRIDPNYVEAMCNIGCLMKSLNKPDSAIEWWWKALRLQPMYWDAMDNLLDLLIDTHSTGQSDTYKRALEACDFVLSATIDDEGRLRKQVPYEQLSRVQNIYCTRANLLQISGERYSGQSLDSYSRAVNLALTPQPAPDADPFHFRDLITSTCILGLHLMEGCTVPARITRLLGFEGELDIQRPRFNLLRTVHQLGNRLVALFHDEHFDILPLIILDIEQMERLPSLLFSAWNGVLPSNCIQESSSHALRLLPDWARDVTNKVTSKVILMVAKHFQDMLSSSATTDETYQSYRISTSLVLLLYYIASTIFPSAIAYNNLGAMISTLSPSVIQTTDGQRRIVTTEHLTTALYRRGLKLDPKHGHLLTNLGSALRDEGDVSGAIQLYAQALETSPELDVALVNMANVLRDVGRPWDAVSFYRRALKSKSFPEATCGIASTLSAVCDWRERGWLKEELLLIKRARATVAEVERGWIEELVESCDQQLRSAYSLNVGFIRRTYTLQDWMIRIQSIYDRPLSDSQRERWERRLRLFYTDFDRKQQGINEGGFLIRLVEWLSRGLQRRWYIDAYGPTFRSERSEQRHTQLPQDKFLRPPIPTAGQFPIPAVLPFHCFTFPLDSRTIRLISHRNALRVSYRTLTQSWLSKHIYPPPPPPHQGRLNIGYVSYDFNDHPLAHLVQSIFRYHDANRFRVHVYATSPDDGSSYRQKISTESHSFLDVSSWQTDAIVNRIIEDKIHILINLGGYTRGAKNDIFAARPCPVQIMMMGFPGPMAAGWCDYTLSDQTSCPPDMRADSVERSDHEPDLHVGTDADPESPSGDWIYTEKMIYMPHTFMVTDHKQSFDFGLSFAEAEEDRMQRRSVIFPDLPPDVFIFANFNQSYKIDPVIFSTWLLILQEIPRSVLWLLRFPPAGEEHLIRTAKEWANDEVASRILFTDVASKEEHVQRAGVADLFLDTAECNAHTVAADVLWSGTPLLTWPKYRHKMCSRVGASIAHATGFGDRMVVNSIEEYYERAIFLAGPGKGVGDDESELKTLRRSLYHVRHSMPLFDTKRWIRNFEKACWEAWERWVGGADFSEIDSDYKPFISITDTELDE